MSSLGKSGRMQWELGEPMGDLAAERLREPRDADRLWEPMGEPMDAERLREPMGEPRDADLLGAAEV